MTTYATLEDPLNPSGAVNFVAEGNLQETIHEEGAIYFPLGLPYSTKSTDGTKGEGGILLITAVGDTMNAESRFS